MRHASRGVKTSILLIFLITITSNCLRAAQGTSNPVISATAVSGTEDCNTDKSESSLAEDNSEDSPSRLAGDGVSLAAAVPLSRALNFNIVLAKTIRRFTILRI